MAYDGFDLTGKVAVITGGNGGIGLGFARAVAAAGAGVSIWGTNPEKNASAEKELQSLNPACSATLCDVSDEAAVEKAMTDVVERYGRIDAQAEAALHFLGPAILDYTVNGRVRTRTGNEDLDMAPHGVYACAGDDRWVAVTVADDAEWAALCRVLEQPDLASDARFATAAARLEHRAVLDGLLTSYTEKLEPEEAERRLQDAGVAASVVKSSREIIVDPQLLHRNHFVEIPNPAGKPTTVEGSRSRLSRTPAQVGGLAPTLGRDNEYVLKEILGYSDERVSELVIAGALE